MKFINVQYELTKTERVLFLLMKNMSLRTLQKMTMASLYLSSNGNICQVLKRQMNVNHKLKICLSYEEQKILAGVYTCEI